VNSTQSQCWRRNSPTSLIRTPLRFTSEEDRQHYRRGIRTLALVYVGFLMLVLAVTGLRAEWHNHNINTKAVAGAVDIPGRY
jgi:hypothetical protein